MASQQTILFTVIPRGVNIDPKTLPVSVFVAPQLTGDDHLGAFPDWLKWTRRLKDAGLTLGFHCEGATLNRPIDASVLRPELWEQMFHEQTLVRSRKYDDYTDRGIISFSMRQSLSALKTIYQTAGLQLALPDGRRGQENRDAGNRETLRQLLNGLDVHWNGDRAVQWRKLVRKLNSSTPLGAYATPSNEALDNEGLITGAPNPAAFKQAAIPFAVFHHMPTPPHDDLTLDTSKVLDFHQALSSLNAYPELLRALGLVFDLELPPEFVKLSAVGKFETISISNTSFAWRLPTKTPELAVAYVHSAIGAHRLFLTAPRSLSDPSSPATILGLLDLAPERFGLAQVDVDGGMHKAIMLAETLNNPDPDRNLDPNADAEPAPHPEVFDPEATLPSLRSGGLSLYADRRGLQLLDMLKQSKGFNDAVESGGAQPRPLFAEDLTRGYRLDVWDAKTGAWHSLHERSGQYLIGDLPFATQQEEGFVQLAAMQPAQGATPAEKDFYLHEAIARWAGWSLSAPRPGKHLSRFADPSKAVPPDGDDPDYREDQPDTPFKMTVKYSVLPGSLPRMRFGTRYRLRARAVDLAGNSMKMGDPLTDALSLLFGLPRDPEGFTYLRYEPVGAPLVVLRDTHGVTDPGSAIDRIVIRTFNDDISKDMTAADTTGGDRHLVPPRTSAEMGERLGMFDDAAGKLKNDPATWQLIADRDAGEFPQTDPIEVAGQQKIFPLVTGDRIDALPYLPDPLSRGAALRDLPGSVLGAIGEIGLGPGAASQVDYKPLSDPNPRAGSATMIHFNEGDDWQSTSGIRLTLAGPAPGQTDLRPNWDPAARLLTIYLPKGQTAVTPLTSFTSTNDLKLMGVWQWLREYIERITITNPEPQYLLPGSAVDQIAHVLQRTVEGGHWMLTPPRLLTLVHAVQQPIGKPAFVALNVDHQDQNWNQNPLQTTSIVGRTDPTELAPITAWRRPGATDAFLLGALRVHGASTARIDLQATWVDPIDDLLQSKWTTASNAAHVDEIPLPELEEGYLRAPGADSREVGYYDPEHDQIAFVQSGDLTQPPPSGAFTFIDAAPRHLFNDTKHHRVSYTATATSRYREYFAQDQNLNFKRTSEPVVVDVPASARPLAASPVYVLPTFGWERQIDTNLKRSVRFGGGLRVYLQRPWFSSGEGELLGVALWSYQNGSLDQTAREKYKPYFTQWGMDPIWSTGNLSGAPGVSNFPDAASVDYGVTLEERSALNAKGEPGRVDVVGFPVEYDESRRLWYADLTINSYSETYSPFVRLALVRYQPHALPDAKVSRVALADFAQLTPDRSALVTADPHHSRTLRVVVSGVAPTGPLPVEPRLPSPVKHPTQIRVRVQERDPALNSDIAWRDVPANVAAVTAMFDDHFAADPNLELWSGTVAFAKVPEAGRYRLLIEEHEYISANYSIIEGRTAIQPGRLIYAETFAIDAALVQAK
jgi:hypothetical protein